jgi:hypothetical protein
MQPPLANVFQPLINVFEAILKVFHDDMEPSSRRVAAAIPRMQERDGLRSHAGGCSQLVPSGRLPNVVRDARSVAPSVRAHRLLVPVPPSANRPSGMSAKMT